MISNNRRNALKSVLQKAKKLLFERHQDSDIRSGRDEADNDFIMKLCHHKNTKDNSEYTITSSDVRRLVFISIIGCFKTWKNCPGHSLYSAILILPIKREWINNSMEHQQELISS